MVNQHPVSNDPEVKSVAPSRQIDFLAAVNSVGTVVSQAGDLVITFQKVLDILLGVIPVSFAEIWTVDETAGELKLHAYCGPDRDIVSSRVSLDDGPFSDVVRDNRVLVWGNLASDLAAFTGQGEIQAVSLVPMRARGRVVGVLSMAHVAPYGFADEEVGLLCAVANQVGVVLENARLYDYSKEQSSCLGVILHSSHDAILVTDSTGQITLINPAAETMFNVRAGEVVGQQLSRVPLHPNLIAGAQRAMRRNGTGGKTVFEIQLDDAGNVLVTMSPVYSHRLLSADEVEGWVMVVQNVTHQYEAKRSHSEFIHTAAHDLRNPLGVTLGALMMLQNDLGEVSDMQHEVINIGIQGVTRMQDLLENLTVLDDIENSLGLDYREVDVRELVERGIVDIQSGLQASNQKLEVIVPDTLPPIQGDMHWLHRALLHLLNNANKYTGDGGVVTLRTYLQESCLYIEVADNGPGIPPEIQPHLFDRFYRAPADKSKKRGSGLGLSIVKAVAEKHGGRVFVQSQLGHGSTFGMVFSLVAEVNV